MKESPPEHKQSSQNNNDSDSDNNSDKEDYKELKESIRNPHKKKKNLGTILKRIVRKSTKPNHTILSKLKEPFEQIKEEAKLKEELHQKREIRKIQKQLGYKPMSHWDKKKERQLTKVATRGVVKLFNNIFNYRKKVKEDKDEEEKKADKRGSNFLMMHNLDPDFKSKFKKDFREDNQQ